MNSEKLYYTDGHHVTVTASDLKVHNKVYHLAGIIRHNLSTLSPPRAPGLAILLIGIAIGLAGVFGQFPANALPTTDFLGRWIGTNEYAIAIGALLLISGLIALIAVRPRYGVHVCTATEEADVVVSSRREYISQIVHGIDRALVDQVLE